MSDKAPPPGWRRDPGGAELWRFWDGAGWTAQTSPRSRGGVPVGPPPPERPAPSPVERPAPSPAERPAPPRAEHPAPPSRPAADVWAPPAADPERPSRLGRLLGRRTAPERAAEDEHAALLRSLIAGTEDPHALATRLDDAAARAGLTGRRRTRARDEAFRALAGRMLADDRLSPDEENELLAAARALGMSQAELDDRFADVVERLIVARINDGRLPAVSEPRLLTRRGEIVHAEFPAELMKEVVHREYRGGSSGVSFPIAPGVRFRTSGFRGRSVVTGTSLEPADRGLLSVSSLRVVFQGERKTQESRLDRLTGVEVFTDGIRLGVSNRQTTSLYRLRRGMVAGALVTAAGQRALGE